MNVRIPRFDHRAQYRAIRQEILDAVDNVFESEKLILGPNVEAFEHKMCGFLGAAGYAIGVGNGTDALAIALRALGIGPGDEVMTVSHTALPTISAIRMAGAVPVYCDIRRDSLLMDVEDAERRITAKTRAIIAVHLYGNAVDMVAVKQLASKHGLVIVEDCAQSCGTKLHGRATGTWGDVGCFSFYPTKNLGAFGDGGLCFTRSRKLADAIRQIRTYGLDGAMSIPHREGVNSRLDELQAALLQVKLKYLPEYLQCRREVALNYIRNLSPLCRILRTTSGAEHSYHLFVVQLNDRDQVAKRLKSLGIESGVHYPIPAHLMNGYHPDQPQTASLPVTERCVRRVLSLPCYPELSESQVNEVCSAVNSAVLADQIG